MSKSISETEKLKYESVRERFPQYDSKNKAKRWGVIDPLMQLMAGRFGTVVELGAGNGDAALEMADRGCNVIMMDIAETAGCHSIKRNGLSSHVHSAWDPWPHAVKGEWCFSSDFFEHVPEPQVDEVLKRIRENIRFGGLALICITAAGKGDKIGKELGVGPLHMTVKGPAWWANKFSHYFKTVRELQKPSGCHCLLYFEIY